jgi:hypothetical protein
MGKAKGKRKANMAELAQEGKGAVKKRCHYHLRSRSNKQIFEKSERLPAQAAVCRPEMEPEMMCCGDKAAVERWRAENRRGVVCEEKRMIVGIRKAQQLRLLEQQLNGGEVLSAESKWELSY